MQACRSVAGRSIDAIADTNASCQWLHTEKDDAGEGNRRTVVKRALRPRLPRNDDSAFDGRQSLAPVFDLKRAITEALLCNFVDNNCPNLSSVAYFRDPFFL